MFQRLKGAIDSRIAEEQARQRQSQASPLRSDSRSRRSNGRVLSPARSIDRESQNGRQDKSLPGKGPDPAEFEPEFVIEGDEPSRASTPKPLAETDASILANKPSLDSGAHRSKDEFIDDSRSFSDLPTDVRVKLRKLEKLESRYHELLRSYRAAHARVLTIEPFENSLRENTPLTSISDPRAFVEYLNQVSLKGDMVLDELKRVSGERDSFKEKLSDAQQSVQKAWDEVTNLRNSNPLGKKDDDNQDSKSTLHHEAAAPGDMNGDLSSTYRKASPTTNKSPTISAQGLPLFSVKPGSNEMPNQKGSSEDLFSYDSELPRLESELQERQIHINGLQNEVKSLKADLAVTRESTQSMVQTLEEATRELTVVKDSKECLECDLVEQKNSSEKLLGQLRADLRQAEQRLQMVQAEHSSRESDRISELNARLNLAKQELGDARAATTMSKDQVARIEELEVTKSKLESEISSHRAESKQNQKKTDTLNNLVVTLRSQLMQAEERNQDLESVIAKFPKNLEDKTDLLQTKANEEPDTINQDMKPNDLTTRDMKPGGDVYHSQEAANASKKKNSKKKKRTAKATVTLESGSSVTPARDANIDTEESGKSMELRTLVENQNEVSRLNILLEKKETALDMVHRKLKDQEGLQEEIENLKDELVNVGQEHVEAKDRIKNLIAEKNALESQVADLGEALAEKQRDYEVSSAGFEQKHQDLAVRFKDLQAKAALLETDLSAAQQLASVRFKDLNHLKDVLQKAQPEINALRNEAAELKSITETLTKKNVEFSNLNAMHEDMHSEVVQLRRTIGNLESELSASHQRITQEINSKAKAHELNSKANSEVDRLETEKRHVTESLERLSDELVNARENLLSSKSRLRELEQHLSTARGDSEGLKEEIDLKTAQYTNAQSLMASMRDQTAEMAMQMKEARERCEGLEEELAEARRLLGERSREGETMRRLLADVEGRADARSREMKERMDTAIEERDRAEDEASIISRRRARELDELRNNYREVERNLRRAEEDREELETVQRDWKRRREELETRAGQSTQEAEEFRKAMGDLRDALDESERHARELEKQKTELRKSIENSQNRLEKLQNSNKSLMDEISRIQSTKAKPTDSGAQSSRSSVDAVTHGGPGTPKGRILSVASFDAPNGQSPGPMDLVYLKNVLLQFLEQKDKKHQLQLVPVLGMLLHFDRKDEQKWMSAITTKS